jgi:hypothetical protein
MWEQNVAMQVPKRHFMRTTEKETINRTITIERATDPFEFIVIVSDHTMSLAPSGMGIDFADPDPQRFPFTVADRDHVQRCLDEQCQKSLAAGFKEMIEIGQSEPAQRSR